MPTPHPETETKDEFMSKCVPMVMEDGSADSQDEAVAMCASMWNEAMEMMPKNKKSKQMRAYSTLTIRATDEEKRIIEGIASTPAIDSYNTILEPEGAQFKLPLPVLYQHNSRQPIGHVIEAKSSKSGIHVRIQIAKTGIAGFIDEAWALIKNGLVRGLSVGFEPIEETFDKTFNGFRYPKWRWLELSTVTIPANQDATMSAVRSADEAILAALGTRNRTSSITVNLPGVSGHSLKGKAMIKDHIAALETKRAANDVKLDAILEKCAKESRSRDPQEEEEFDNLTAEQRSLDKDISAFKDREKSLAARAAVIAPASNGQEPQKHGQDLRQGGSIEVRSAAPKGIGMARYAKAIALSRLTFESPESIARRQWPDSPEVATYIRSIVEAGDTTTSGWASQLVPSALQLPNEFLELLRPATILGRIQGKRSVPFNTAVPIETAGGTFQWVGESVAKPVTSLTFSSATLRWAKAAGIVVITEELARNSSPSAEMIIRDSMIKSLTRFFDTAFVSATAEVSNVSPAGILNGIAAITASGTTAAAFRTDFNNMLNNFTANSQPLGGIVILMSATTAVALSLMVTDLGVPLFPTIGRDGGSILGFPVVVSENVSNRIIGVQASDILHADDGAIRVDVSREATIEMETTPAVGEQSPPTTQSVLKSMFQNNLIALRAEQYNTWKVARSSAVEFIQTVAYVP